MQLVVNEIKWVLNIMRIDDYLSKLSVVSKGQAYFLACWFNMVHEYSLDSYRVRVMNTPSILREVDKILNSRIANNEDKIAVLSEAKCLLLDDPVLKSDELNTQLKNLLEFLVNINTLFIDKNEESLRLFKYFLKEFRKNIDQKYIQLTFSQLEKELVGSNSASDGAEYFNIIHQLTGGLLSSLLDQGFCLESLFQIYMQVFVPRKLKSSYKFENKFGLARKLLALEDKSYTVVLAIDNISKSEDFPKKIASIEISVEAPFPIQERFKSSYLTGKSRRLFTTINVKAKDPRGAGSVAFEKLNEVVNLLRFEYENSRIQLPELFAVAEIGREHDGARLFKLPMLVPNPIVNLDGIAVSQFVKSIEELMAEVEFNSEGRDRIYSAFRLYRLGRDTDVLENKLLNWWTAVEYLARGTNATSSNIGVSIQQLLTPVICIQYLDKHLSAIKNILVECQVDVRGSDHVIIGLRGVSTKELFCLFRNIDIQKQALSGLQEFPYLHEQIRLFFLQLIDLKILSKKFSDHEQRIKWQLARIYRLRCDIVHSASKEGDISLICSNLEYYLKSVLHALLRSLNEVPTLSGPKEFFDRQSFFYKKMLKDLSEDNVNAIIKMF